MIRPPTALPVEGSGTQPGHASQPGIYDDTGAARNLTRTIARGGKQGGAVHIGCLRFQRRANLQP